MLPNICFVRPLSRYSFGFLSTSQFAADMPFPPASTALLLTVVIGLVYAIYRASIPKPIPGIPHNPDAARKPFGDIPAAMKWHADNSELATFFQAKVKELDSPITQMFMRPFGRPWVVIADSRE